MANFLIATMPVPGHVAPIAPVARTLIQRGHQVLWYGSAAARAGIEATGSTFAPIVSTLDYGDSQYNRYFPDRVKLSGLKQVVFDFEHLFVGAVPGYVTDLRALAATFHPDVLLTDPAVAAAAILDEMDGLITATINISVLGIESVDTAPFGPGVPPMSGPVGRLRNRALYWLIDHVVFRSVNKAYRALAVQHGWPVFPFRPATGDWLYLQPSVPAFEYARSDLPQQVHFIGPLLPLSDPAAPTPSWWPDLLAARAAGTAIVLVTQGTIATDPSELILPTIQSLADAGVFVVAAGADPAAIGPLPANARAAEYIPFVDVMPLVDVYVTNGGYGGVTVALANGVPIVTAGTTEDKAEVGCRVAHSGVGLNLRTNRPPVAKIRSAVLEVLATPRYRDRAREIQAQFALHDAPAEAAVLLERLASTRQPVTGGPGVEPR